MRVPRIVRPVTATARSGPVRTPRAAPLSPWAPLHHRVFAALFAAQLGSNIGSFFQAVAAAWLMGDLTSSPTPVALIQTASLLPVLVLGLVAGALADIMDRRKLLIATQAWMTACAGALAVLTLLDVVTPAGLLGLTFAMGVGAALMVPAWQAIQPDLVPAEEFSQAVALSSLTFNTGRAIGPALAGALVAAAGPGWAFVVNALSFVGVAAVLLWWRPEQVATRLPPETLAGAVRTGWRYGANAPALRAVLIRTAAFAPPAAAVQALLPLVVRDRLGLGPGAFGLMLGCFGLGAVIAAVVRPRLEVLLTPDRLLVATSFVVAAVLVVTATTLTPWVLAIALGIAGGAWTTGTVTTTVATQRALPWWVRARGLGLYQIVLAGGIAIGSAVWGGLAAWSIPGALLTAATALVVGSMTVFRWQLRVVQDLDLRPVEPTQPMVTLEPAPTAGPVLVTVRYRVPPDRQDDFTAMMRRVERDRRRRGSSDWGLFRDLADPDVFLETFAVATWAEHLRHHERRTVNADVTMQRVREFVEGDVEVAHLLSAYSAGELRPVEPPPEPLVD
jgi:MFS family permease